MQMPQTEKSLQSVLCVSSMHALRKRIPARVLRYYDNIRYR